MFLLIQTKKSSTYRDIFLAKNVAVYVVNGDGIDYQCQMGLVFLCQRQKHLNNI